MRKCLLGLAVLASLGGFATASASAADYRMPQPVYQPPPPQCPTVRRGLFADGFGFGCGYSAYQAAPYYAPYRPAYAPGVGVGVGVGPVGVGVGVGGGYRAY